MMTDKIPEFVRQPSATRMGGYNSALGADLREFCSLPQQNWLNADYSDDSAESPLERLVSNTSRVAGIVAFVASFAALAYWII